MVLLAPPASARTLKRHRDGCTVAGCHSKLLGSLKKFVIIRDRQPFQIGEWRAALRRLSAARENAWHPLGIRVGARERAQELRKGSICFTLDRVIDPGA